MGIVDRAVGDDLRAAVDDEEVTLFSEGQRRARLQRQCRAVATLA